MRQSGDDHRPVLSFVWKVISIKKYSLLRFTKFSLDPIMNFRYLILFTTTMMILTACNFTLAEDITPPPNYVPPTPAATLGPLFPAQAPSTVSGAAIFAEKCAACHGETGMGDGEQGIKLNVTVPAFGLPEIAR